ncbi:MAG: HAMP domain-containing protein [Gammaproteobacteria bacterium]|nr:HAMP domain-containing protein [Gammaproteobacteria bacterium]NIR85250.1 HAMP domain-containing protein [Gammaproteobacteria bacterium]NIR88369.1 HAMP domain-containing protein [Gammaproteobacteria bacterium]NIU06319.1 HAMP domain-containing protein [Gammaproteobacteria bacterium]NIV53218.1 HAMP domain-containing protein [Gammaproteobacteria bacterium]
MKLFSSRTIVQLDVFGLVLVALPLITVLVTALIAVDDLIKRSQRAIFVSANTVDASRLLVEQTNDMVRSAQQFLVLGDEEVYEVYTSKREQFRATLDELARLGLDEAQRQILERLSTRERRLFEGLEEYRADSEGASPPELDFSELGSLARATLFEASHLMGRRANDLRRAATELERKLVMQSFAVIPLALVLGAVFTFFVAKPLRQMNRAIRQLGRGEFGNPIEVSGARDLEELGQRLDWLRTRLVGLEQQKVNFLRHVSHELKTPLATMREGTELLCEQVIGPLNQAQAEVAQILSERSRRLQKLIEDLLQFSVEEPRERMSEARPLALEKLVRRVLVDHKVSLAARKLKVSLGLEPVSVTGREEQLRVVLENLLSNAIKYSPRRGRVRVTLKAQDSRAVLDVQDEGPGIPPEDRERIFEVFYQGQATSGSVKGTGLGLAIAKEYVTLHGGTIEAVNEPGGAHLRVSLPLRAPEPQTAPGEEAGASAASVPEALNPPR